MLPPADRAVAGQRSGDRFVKIGDLRSAAREYDRAVRSAPNDPVLRLSAGVALAAIRDVDSAAAHFRQAWSLAEDDVIAALLLQGALTEQGKTAEAQRLLHDTVRRFARAEASGLDASGSVRRLTQAAHHFPDSAIVHLLLGDAYQVGEQWDPAARAYHRAVGLAPQWTKPRVNLGVLLLTQGRADEALKQFEAALAREPKNAQVRLHQGDALIRMGRAGDALKTLRKVGGGSREVAADAETRIGQIHLQNNQTAAAIRSFLRAKSLAPKDPGPAAGYAEAQVRAGNYEAGAEAYRSALRLAEAGGLLSTRPILYRGLTESQLSARSPDAALRTLERALQDEPQAAPLWHRLRGEAYFSKRDPQAAEAALRQGLDSDIGQYPIDILNAVAARNLLGRVTAAYTAELSVPARRAKALVALAHLAQYEGDLAKEVRLREQAKEAQPDGVNWLLLANAYERAGRAAEARAAYDRALQLGGLPEPARENARARLQALPAQPARP